MKVMGIEGKRVVGRKVMDLVDILEFDLPDLGIDLVN